MLYMDVCVHVLKSVCVYSKLRVCTSVFVYSKALLCCAFQAHARRELVYELSCLKYVCVCALSGMLTAVVHRMCIMRFVVYT